MKVSIVTISFNQAVFLERALRSVVEQDYSDVEYIVVDPGSTDGSREIIHRYRDRISTLILEPDRGPVDGLNKGFAQATGDLYFFLNADDALLPGAVREVVEQFRKHPEADVVCGAGYLVDAAGKVTRRIYSDRINVWRYVHGASMQVQQSTFFRREAFLGVGGFNPDAKVWWDGELFLDFCLGGKRFRVVDRFWSIFTLHEESLTGQELLDLKTERASAHERVVDAMWRHLYRKALGRDPDARTRFLMMAARAQRLLLNPISTAWKTIYALGLRPDHAVFAPVMPDPRPSGPERPQ